MIYLIFVFGVFSIVKFDESKPTYNYSIFGENFTIKSSSSKYTNATVISDDYTNWNNDNSYDPSIAVDDGGNLHVVWHDHTNGPWGSDTEIMYVNYSSSAGWSNAIVISDNGTNWNNGISENPSIAVDDGGNIHVVWHDHTDGPWGTDIEIMYVNHSSSAGWSNAIVISDDGTNWNNDNSRNPSIALDSDGNIHVAWHDLTDGPWGTDTEIMYVNHSSSAGWSNATVISDDGTNWNNDESISPSIAIDNGGNIHVVWHDLTDGPWGTDGEIMYVNHSSSAGWSNAIVISDDGTNWNNGDSRNPSIAVDNGGNVHVVWHDFTDGSWGTDIEIMYVNHSSSAGWSNVIVISDDGTTWNDGASYEPSITVDNGGNIHVVWYDSTYGPWTSGADTEIMYVKYSSLAGWSNATVISDGSGGIYWNDDDSEYPSIAVDNGGNAHVVWHDFTDGPWGTDSEIMYTFIGDIVPVIIINSPTPNEYIGSVAPHFNISIVGLFLNTTWYTLDDGKTNITFSGLTGTINQTEWAKKGNGTVTIRFYANNTAGKEGYDEVTVYKDTIAPISSISYIVHKEPNMVNISTTFTLTADNASGSGVSVIRYKINDSGWLDYNSPFDLDLYAYGDLLISYQAIDEVGNIETVNTELVELMGPPSEPCELVKLLQVEITENSYSTEHFNFTFLVFNELGQAIDFATIQIWWNGNDVSDDVVNLGNGLYFVSLEPKTVAPGEDPILLKMIISASGYEDKLFETYLAVDPETLEKEVGKGAEGVPLVTIIIAIISTVSGISVAAAAVVLLRKRKRASEVI